MKKCCRCWPWLWSSRPERPAPPRPSGHGDYREAPAHGLLALGGMPMANLSEPTHFSVREDGNRKGLVLIHGFHGDAHQTFGMLPAFLAGTRRLTLPCARRRRRRPRARPPCFVGVDLLFLGPPHGAGAGSRRSVGGGS